MTAPDDPFASPPRSGGHGDPPPPPSYGPPPSGPGTYPATQTEPKAWVALGLAIAAYTPILPFLAAILALVVVHYARRDIRASGGRLTGLDICTWATVLAVVHLVLVGLLLLFVVAVFVLPFSLTFL